MYVPLPRALNSYFYTRTRDNFTFLSIDRMLSQFTWQTNFSIKISFSLKHAVDTWFIMQHNIYDYFVFSMCLIFSTQTMQPT